MAITDGYSQEFGGGLLKSRIPSKSYVQKLFSPGGGGGEIEESWGCYAWKFFVWPDKKSQKLPKDLKSFHVNRRARWNTFEQPADKPGRSCPMLAS